jgi:hypothetical protein
MHVEPDSAAQTPAALISQRIADLADWRGDLLARVRQVILAADPTITEDWRWRGVPVWYQGGMLCTGESYKAVVKLTFAKGASLPDPAGLFNASLHGGTRRAIDFRAGDIVNEQALTALIQAAVLANHKRKRTAAAA